MHEFKMFDRVLVRDDDSCAWHGALFNYIKAPSEDDDNLRYYVIGEEPHFQQCIPYEGNERLANTTDGKWTPKVGELVAVQDNDDGDLWHISRFSSFNSDGEILANYTNMLNDVEYLYRWDRVAPLKSIFKDIIISE